MKTLSDWGFTWEGLLNGRRGEYWVMGQGLLFLGFVLLPVHSPTWLQLSPPLLYLVWAAAAIIGLVALYMLKGFLDLGRQLTPLPYPKEEGELVKSGVYGIVRHPIYTGIILAAIAWAVFQLSWTHLLGAIAIFALHDAKATREEAWLEQKYPEYPEYRQRVKKLLPGIY